MAEAVPDAFATRQMLLERHLQQAAAAGRQHVTAWSERHTAPHFQTDLWFIVTDENGEKTRVPACHAVLNINCLFLHSFQAGDDVEIPQTICTNALTFVYFLWLNYPRLMYTDTNDEECIAHSPFECLVEGVLDKQVLRQHDENRTKAVCLAIAKLAKLADWIQCGATIMRLQDIMDKIRDMLNLNGPGKYSKYLYMAQFAVNDVLYRNSNLERMMGTTPASAFAHRIGACSQFVLEFPVAFLSMNAAERTQFADHVVPMFEVFLEGSTSWTKCGNTTGLSLSTQRTLIKVNKFLLDFYKNGRAIIDAKEEKIKTLKHRTFILRQCCPGEVVSDLGWDDDDDDDSDDDDSDDDDDDDEDDDEEDDDSDDDSDDVEEEQ